MSAAAVIIIRANRIIRRFRELDAVDPARTVTYDDIGVRSRFIWSRLQARGVIIQPTPGRYYLDEPAAEAWRTRRRTISLLMAVIALLLFGLYLLGAH